jgi:pimeloyl-ACP methyl ester carboxylesterase
MPLIQIDDVQLAYDSIGSGSPIIFVHGYPFNRTLWSEQVAALSDKYRVITVDLRGFGESSSSGSPATMSRMAQDVAKLMDELNISAATLAGLSMGGYVLLSFYKQFEDRVSALVLADTRAGADTEEGKKVRAQQAETILAEGMAGTADAMLQKLLTPETVAKRADIVKRVRDMMVKTKPEGAAAALMGMASREDHTDLLSQIKCPTLILVGRTDPITPVADSELMHQKINDSKLIVIENAAHVSNIEQVDKFNTALKSFLGEPGQG